MPSQAPAAAATPPTTPVPAPSGPQGPSASGKEEAWRIAAQKAADAGAKNPNAPEINPKTPEYWAREDIQIWAKTHPELAERLKKRVGYKEPGDKTEGRDSGPSPEETRGQRSLGVLAKDLSGKGPTSVGAITITSEVGPRSGPAGLSVPQGSHLLTISTKKGNTLSLIVDPEGTVTAGCHKTSKGERQLNLNNPKDQKLVALVTKQLSGGKEKDGNPEEGAGGALPIKPDGTITAQEKHTLAKLVKNPDFVDSLKERFGQGAVTAKDGSLSVAMGTLHTAIGPDGTLTVMLPGGQVVTNPDYVREAEKRLKDAIAAFERKAR